jgi:uncharacterized repeat protein (TIGR01451 family)
MNASTSVNRPGYLFAVLLMLFSQAAWAVPDNDNFADSIDLGNVASGTFFGSNIGATAEPGEDSLLTGDDSVWWSWTAPGNGFLMVSTCGEWSDFDTVLGVYTGTAVDALTEEATNDEDYNCWWESFSTVWLLVEEHTTYHIAVDGWSDYQGSIQLDLSFTEVSATNDDFADSIDLGIVESGTFYGSNFDATVEPGEESLPTGDDSVWWSWTAPEDGILTATTCGEFTNFDTIIAIYSGTAVDALTTGAENDDDNSCTFGTSSSTASAVVVANTTYYIAVDGYSSEQGIIQLGLTFTSAAANAPNDNFADRIDLGSAFTVDILGTNTGATREPDEPVIAYWEEEDEFGDSYGSSVWWSWTAPADGELTFSTCYPENDFDTHVAILTGDQLTPDMPIEGENDNFYDCPYLAPDPVYGSYLSQVSVPVTSGTIYNLRIDGWYGWTGNIRAGLRFVPANDDFSGSIDLGSGEVAHFNGTNGNSSVEVGEPGFTGDDSVWWSWTAPADGMVTLTTCDKETSFDTRLGFYTGSSVDALTTVDIDDDDWTCQVDLDGDGQGDESRQSNSTITTEVVGGTTYHIAVDGNGREQGNISGHLHFSSAIPNDDFIGQIDLGNDDNATFNGGNEYAGSETGEPGATGGRSVWWSWASPADGTLTLTTCLAGTDFDTRLGLYLGTSVDALTTVASNDDDSACQQDKQLSTIVAGVISSQIYRIAVDGNNNAQGTIFGELALDRSPTASTSAYSINEGEGLQLDASASFDPEGTPLSFSWDLDGDGAFDDGGGAMASLAWSKLSTIGLDDSGSYTIALRVSDGLNRADTTTTLRINNISPSIDLSGESSATAGLEYKLGFGAVTDPGDDSISGCSIDWGDGSPAEDCTAALVIGSLSHVYRNAGPYSIGVTLTDEDGSVLAGSHALKVLTPAASADLSAHAATPYASVANGDYITYDLRIHNKGEAMASNPAAAFMLPAGTTLISHSIYCSPNGTMDQLTCVQGDLRSGESQTFSATLEVDAAGGGGLTAQLNVASDTADPDPSNNGVSISVSILSSNDLDGDGMADDWEQDHRLSPADYSDQGLDLDYDGLTSLQEYQAGTDPNNGDSDSDGVSDGDELAIGTDPNRADTDGDGLVDSHELYIENSDPLDNDTDADGLLDGWDDDPLSMAPNACGEGDISFGSILYQAEELISCRTDGTIQALETTCKKGARVAWVAPVIKPGRLTAEEGCLLHLVTPARAMARSHAQP